MSIPGWFHPLAALALAAGPCPAAATPAPSSAPAYHGGALLVTDPRFDQGHLAPGQVLPIRLSRLTRPAAGVPPPLGGAETPGSVRYGDLTFLQVTPARLTFSVAFRDGGPARTITLRQGQAVDLTGDGLPDLELKAPVKALKAGAKELDYALLAFPCDGAHAALFALAPGAFRGNRYPYGISGVTPAGQFIFQSDCLPSSPVSGPAGLLFPDRAGPAFQVRPEPGDVLVEVATGRFGPIDSVRRSGSGLELRYAAATTPFQFRNVFGAARVQVSGNLADLARRYRCGPASLWTGSLDLLDIATTQHLLDDAHGKLDLQLAARLSVELSLSVNADFYGVSGDLAAYLDETLRLAAAFRADRPFSGKLGPVPLAQPQLGFAVFGVPMALALDLSTGLDVDNQDTGSLLEGLRATGRWGWRSEFAATWGWHGVQVNAPAPVVTDTLVLEALPENVVHFNGQATLRPWLSLTPRLTFGSIFRAEGPNTLAAVASVSNGGGNPHAQLDVTYQLAARFCLELPFLGQVWDRTWPLQAWTGTVWASDHPQP